MKKLKTMIRAVWASAVLLCVVFGAVGCTTNNDKASAVSEIEAYAELMLKQNEYSEENKIAIKSLKGEGTKAVKTCKDHAELEQTVNAIKIRMDAVETIQSCVEDISGALYSLEKTYNNGFIVKSDLKRIAYYYNDRKIQYPYPLNDRIEQAIKETYAQDMRDEANSPEWAAQIQADGFRIVGYYGTYSGCYVVSVDSVYWSYPANIVDEWRDICGVKFHFTGHYGIIAWKMN